MYACSVIVGGNSVSYSPSVPEIVSKPEMTFNS